MVQRVEIRRESQVDRFDSSVATMQGNEGLKGKLAR